MARYEIVSQKEYVKRSAAENADRANHAKNKKIIQMDTKDVQYSIKRLHLN